MANKLSPFRTGGGDVLVNIQADEEDLQAAETWMLEIAGDLDNIAKPMLAARRIAMQDMQDHFDKEEDPQGDPWMELDPDYARWKESIGGPNKILQLTGALMKAATSQEAWLVTDNMLMFNPGVLPDYGILHQTGTGAEADVHRRADLAASDPHGTHTSLGIGRGSALPARPFIGMSEEAEGKIWKLFDAWFEETGSGMSISNTGVVQSRGAGGRFGSKVVF